MGLKFLEVVPFDFQVLFFFLHLHQQHLNHIPFEFCPCRSHQLLFALFLLFGDEAEELRPLIDERNVSMLKVGLSDPHDLLFRFLRIFHLSLKISECRDFE